MTGSSDKLVSGKNNNNGEVFKFGVNSEESAKKLEK